MASQLVARGRAACPRKPGSGHADTISITVYMPGPGGTPWNPGSSAFKRRGSPVPWRRQ